MLERGTQIGADTMGWLTRLPVVDVTEPYFLTCFAIGVGIVLLLMGRRLYWVFVAGVGFGLGLLFADSILVDKSHWLMYVIPVIAGVLAALASVFLQKVAIRLAGILAGAYLGYLLFDQFFVKPWPLAGLVVGSVVGGWFVMALFDWALIVLSSIIGALIIVDRVSFEGSVGLLVLLLLTVVGLSFQSHALLTTRPSLKET